MAGSTSRERVMEFLKLPTALGFSRTANTEKVNRLVMTEGTLSTMLMSRETAAVSPLWPEHLIRHMVYTRLTGTETTTVLVATLSALTTVRSMLLQFLDGARSLLIMLATPQSRKPRPSCPVLPMTAAYSREISGT